MSQDLYQETVPKLRQAQCIDGRPPQVRKAPYRSIHDLLSCHAETSGDKTFLIYYGDSDNRQTFTYAEFMARATQAANFMVEDLGIRHGDRVATIAYNHVDTALIYFACWMIGATVAPQNISEDDRRIAFILRDSEARVCFVRGEYMQRAHRIISEEGAPNIEHVIQVGGRASGCAVDFYEATKNRPTTLRGADTVSLDDEALLVYTSGTTGAPKGVTLSQYNILVDAQGISQWQAITGGQRAMCVLPIHHVNGILMTIMTPLYAGGSTVLNRRFSVSHFWQRIAREKVDYVSVVPTLLQFLLEYGQRERDAGRTIFGAGINHSDLTHLRHIICAAGTLSLALARQFSQTFGLTILHGYGLSETTCFSSFLPIGLSWEANQRWLLDYGYPSIGCAIAPNEMAIFAADGSGERLGEGQRGEICIRGHNVMQGYFKRPKANAETFKFGWFRSGDEGFYKLDEHGRPFFFITGRIKELINRGGVKFSPLDIEEVLLGIEGVKVGLAVGFQNRYYGEEIGAYVVLEDGAELTEEAILPRCRERMPFEKSPKVVVFGSEIPVTATGKYQRLKLQPLFAEWEGEQFSR